MSEKHEERMRRFGDAGLYMVTSSAVSRGRATREVVRAALCAGVRLVQLREKDTPVRDLVRLARDVKAMTDAEGALLIINDRLDVALAVDADGVHLGQSDLPVADARRLAPDLIIGASSHCTDEALDAQKQGASYVNIGPIFATTTKDWKGAFLGTDGLREIAGHLTTSFSVMGGIKRKHIPHLIAAGARTIAVVTAITMADDPEVAARELLAAIRKGIRGPHADADYAGGGAGPV